MERNLSDIWALLDQQLKAMSLRKTLDNKMARWFWLLSNESQPALVSAEVGAPRVQRTHPSRFTSAAWWLTTIILAG
jgi:hypothetical protein